MRFSSLLYFRRTSVARDIAVVVRENNNNNNNRSVDFKTRTHRQRVYT